MDLPAAMCRARRRRSVRTRTRTKPCACRFSNRSRCSPLRPVTTGARIISRVPSGSASTVSTICETVCDSSACSGMIGAIGGAGTRVQQAQVVVDLGHRAHGRARIVAGRLLLDRDRRRQALDQVDVGLLHQLQELAGIGRQRFDVAALAFRIQRVERQRRLAGARQAGDDHQAGCAGCRWRCS